MQSRLFLQLPTKRPMRLICEDITAVPVSAATATQPYASRISRAAVGTCSRNSRSSCCMAAAHG